MRLRHFLPAFILFQALTSWAREEESSGSGRDKLVIVGDSTACNYTKGMPYRGWGQFVHYYLKDDLEVVDLARPGRSTKTFMTDGSWKGALKLKPKFILIQFGTNDAHDPHAKEAVDAEVSYRLFLEHYVDGALAISAIPILISPAHPRVFGKDRKVMDVFPGYDLRGYEQTMREVATSRGVAMVDLYEASRELYDKMGPEQSAQFDPVFKDKIHFNIIGAKAMTELVMRRLPKVEPRIKDHLAAPPQMFSDAQE